MAAIVADLRFVTGESRAVEKLYYMELTADLDAACDGLRLRFCSENEPDEISGVTLFIDGKKVFCGLCDRQEFTRDKNGSRVFVYARSNAALLVDNEAAPATYVSPSTNVLFKSEAKRFGFKNRLPHLVCEHEYSVVKGTSCYGAINRFVKTMTQTPVRVNCENELVLPASSEVADLDGADVIRFKKCINRAAPITKIDYKISADTPYIRHVKSRMCEENGIVRTRKQNISSLPEWQRQYTLTDLLQSAAKEYYTAEAVINGCRFFELNSSLCYRAGGILPQSDYRLNRLVLTYDENGENTKLVFLKTNDLKEVTYVAE